MEQSYESRLQQLATRFNFSFNVKKKGMLVFGHHEGEYKETDSIIAQLLGEHNCTVRTLVELGVNWGASLFMLARFAKIPANIIGVDSGVFPGIHHVHRILDALREEGHNVRFLRDTTRRAVARVHAFAPIDLLHIDADHSYESARHDWEQYTPMVRRNGIILLHDISFATGVRRLWHQRKGTLERFFEIETGNRGMALVVKTWGVSDGD